MPRLRLAFEWLTIAALAALAACTVAFTAGGQQLSNWLFDRELAWSQHTTDPRILIAAIDEHSLTRIGKWPWSRQVHSQIVDRLSAANVAAIGYDVLFTEPGEADHDAALAAAVLRSGRVALPAYAQFPGSNGRDFDVQLPLPELSAAARTIGHVNVLFDSDGQVRRAQLQSADKPQHMPHLMQALAQSLRGADATLPGELVIPYNPAGTYPTIPIAAILRGEVPQGLLAGKIVLVGATAQGMGDILPVSGAAGSVMSGIEVQANLLDSILANRWVRDFGAVPAALAAIALLLLVMAIYWRATPTVGLVTTLALGLAALGLSALALAQLRIWISPLPLLVALMLAYPLWNWRRLSALNAFVEHETRALNLDLGFAPPAGPPRTGLDAIAAAAGRLRSVIGELRDRRSFLRETIESAPDALCVVDRNGRVVMANRLATALFTTPSEGASIATLLAGISANGSISTEELVLNDGRTLLVKTVPFSAALDAETGSILRLADITARRNAERARDEALEFLSHDLRSPQASILTTLATMPSPGDLQPALTRIGGYAVRTLKLADDFVQLARLTTIAARRDLIDLNGVFEEAIDGLYDAARAKQLTITLVCIGELAPITGDAGLLLRAAGNLLDNAVKYSPAGSAVACRIEPAGPAEVVATISDSGPGIAPERMAALFERFGTIDRSSALSAGLGLAFVKRAVELNGGAIACTSGSAGTTFRLTFPLTDEALPTP